NTKRFFTVNKHLMQWLLKAKSLIFERYILILFVPMGFIFEFIVTSPFIILCALDNYSRKKK
ncbi:MAG: hypothetical protein KKB94_07485, partial [Proteobacteria bacterium]|nr:hypothetical protein [Pseudomonadota bacterium]